MRLVVFLFIILRQLRLTLSFCMNQRFQIQVGDVVEYKLPIATYGKQLGLGVIVNVNNDVKLHPLCYRSGEDLDDKEYVLVEDESQDPIIIVVDGIVRSIEDVYFSQRPIEDRKLNPHGEHSEDVYLIKATAIDIAKLFLSHDNH